MTHLHLVDSVSVLIGGLGSIGVCQILANLFGRPHGRHVKH